MENESDSIEVTQSSYPVYKAFLRYFYTGEVNLPVTEALELLDLANSCCENALKVRSSRSAHECGSSEACFDSVGNELTT